MRKSNIARLAGPLTIFTNEPLPIVQFILQKDDLGGVVDLTGSTIVFYVSRLDGDKMLMTGGGTIGSSSDGEVFFTFPSRFTSPGDYEIQGRITFADGKIQRTQKLLLKVVSRTAR